MKSVNLPVILSLVVVGLAAACGFECDVAGEAQVFADCDALQSAYDAEDAQQRPDNQVLDDLDTCGEAHGCEVQP